MILLSEAFEFIEHTLHFGAQRGAIDDLRMVNEAGVLLCSSYSWNWLRRKEKQFSIGSGTTSLALGPDVQEVISVHPLDLNTLTLVQRTLTELRNLRSSGTAPGSVLYYAPVSAPDIDGGPVRQRLEIWPSQSATIVVVYRATWKTVGADVEPKEYVLELPEWIEPLYWRVLSAVAKGYEEDATFDLDSALMAAFDGPIGRNAKRADSATFASLGQIRNGAVQPMWQRGDSGWYPLRGKVTGPD